MGEVGSKIAYPWSCTSIRSINSYRVPPSPTQSKLVHVSSAPDPEVTMPWLLQLVDSGFYLGGLWLAGWGLEVPGNPELPHFLCLSRCYRDLPVFHSTSVVGRHRCGSGQLNESPHQEAVP